MNQNLSQNLATKSREERAVTNREKILTEEKLMTDLVYILMFEEVDRVDELGISSFNEILGVYKYHEDAEADKKYFMEIEDVSNENMKILTKPVKQKET